MEFLRDALLRRLRLLTVLAAVGIVVALFVGGAQPIAVGLVPSPWDKLAHASVFAVLAVTLGIASGMRGWRVFVLAFVGALLVGLLDEWHQVFLPGRQAGWDDFLADAIGGAIGAGAAYAFVGRGGTDVDG